VQNVITTILTDKDARSEGAIETLLVQAVSDLSLPWASVNDSAVAVQ